MKAISVKTHSFPGDTFIRIDVDLQDGSGRIWPMFGVWPRCDRAGHYYESDGGGYYKSMREVKEAAIKRAQQEINRLGEIDYWI